MWKEGCLSIYMWKECLPREIVTETCSPSFAQKWYPFQLMSKGRFLDFILERLSVHDDNQWVKQFPLDWNSLKCYLHYEYWSIIRCVTVGLSCSHSQVSESFIFLVSGNSAFVSHQTQLLLLKIFTLTIFDVEILILLPFLQWYW